MPHTTIYAARRLQATLGACLLGLLGLAAHSHGADALAVSLGLLAVAGAAFLLRRPRLEVTDDGLTVVNFARSYRLPWTDIAGFGFGSARMTSCLAIRRRDGSSVNVIAVSDDVRSGYSPQRVSEIVGDLQQRLRAVNGSSAAPEVEFVPERRARRNSFRLTAAMWLLLFGFLLIFGSATAWRAASDLPRTYSRLSARGVHATAVFAGCRVTGLRDDVCRLTLTFAGRTRTWNYGQDFPQFTRLPVGAPVAVLVDPKRPATVYTVQDVETRENAGFGALAVFGVVLAAIGAAGLTWFFWSRRRLKVASRLTVYR